MVVANSVVVHGEKRVTNLFTLQLAFMVVIGEVPLVMQQYLEPYLGQKFARWVSNAYSAFCVFQSLNLALLFIWTTWGKMTQHGDLEEITDAMTMVIIYSFAAYATTFWIWNGKRLLTFLNLINQYYRQNSLYASRIVSIKSAHERAQRLAFIWQVSCGLGVLMWGVAPLILNIRALPLKCWYPFDVMAPIWYETLYAIQLHAQINMGEVFGASGSLLMSIIIIVLAQFDILYCSLKHMPEHAMLLAGINDRKILDEMKSPEVDPETEEPNQYLFLIEEKPEVNSLPIFEENIKERFRRREPSLQNALHATLVDCVLHHQFLIECCTLLEEIFNPYCLIKSLQITLQLCLLVFVTVEGTTSILGILNLVQYVGLTFTELLMFTYCGELLRNHTVRSAEAFSRSPWWPCAHLIRKDLLIFITNSKKTMRLTAGKFYTMDVDRLRSVVTQAISFLTLLQKLAEKRPD